MGMIKIISNTIHLFYERISIARNVLNSRGSQRVKSIVSSISDVKEGRSKLFPEEQKMKGLGEASSATNFQGTSAFR